MKKIRCPYFELNDLERAYHDKEWGAPCRNDYARFCFRYKELRRLIIKSMRSGLAIKNRRMCT